MIKKLTVILLALFSSACLTIPDVDTRLLQVTAQTAVEVVILNQQQRNPKEINELINTVVPILRGEGIDLDIIEDPRQRALARNIFNAYLAQATGVGEAQRWASSMADALEFIGRLGEGNK